MTTIYLSDVSSDDDLREIDLQNIPNVGDYIDDITAVYQVVAVKHNTYHGGDNAHVFVKLIDDSNNGGNNLYLQLKEQYQSGL